MSIEAATEEFDSANACHEGSAPELDAPNVAVESGAIRNFRLMALYQIVLRTGWIFKTESIIMPAVLDLIGGPGWLRGCLPMLNRFGQSIPPVLASGRVHGAKRKKWILAASTLLMGLSFCTLAMIWLATGGQPTWWMPAAFLLIYGIFFVSTGINQLAFGTLTGKLISVSTRGRLMLFASTIGTVTAVFCAATLLPAWLQSDSANFFAIFAFTGVLFLAGAGVALMLDEREDDFPSARQNATTLFRSAAAALTEDAELRRLAIVSSLFGMSLTLFPHYQALGRDRLGLGLDALMPWVITQNVGVAVFSIPAGWLADRFGNRLALRLLLAIVCVVPVIALALASWESPGGSIFALVFFFLGATPVTIRTLTNYCLELAPRAQQPRYLSTLSLCTAGPAIITAPLLGGLVDWMGFEPVFLLVVACLIVALLLTARLVEPRYVRNQIRDKSIT